MARASVRRWPSLFAGNYLWRIDDKAARKRVSAFNPKVKLLDTESVVVTLIQENRISVEEADEIKGEWEREHRFKLGYGSFAERL